MNTCIPTLIKTIQSHYDYATIWNALEAKGKQLFGEHFSFHETDAPVLLPLMAWMLRDAAAAAQFDIDLQKGILLTGPVGAGKTCIMHLLRYLAADAEHYLIRSCREVSFEFGKDGFEVIHRYSRNSFTPYNHLPKAYCFDDLGLESPMQHYGMPCQVMAEVLLSRYDLFVMHGMITHVTTNLNSREIEARYGMRVRSRMREMFNRVAFDGGTEDKRG